MALFFLLTGLAHGQTWQWATQSSGVFGSQSRLAVDGAGNSYELKTFAGTRTFENGLSITYTAAPGSNDADVFLVKYNASGQAQWVKLIDYSTYPGRSTVTVDGTGSVYITGSLPFGTTVSFDNQTTLAGTGYTDSYLAKYNSAGTFQWAIKLGGISTTGIAADATGNAYITGTLIGAFGPLTGGAANGDQIIARFAPSGTLSWAVKPTDNLASTQGIALVLDKAGTVWALGRAFPYGPTGSIQWGGTTLYQPTTLYSNPVTYVVKLSASTGAASLAYEAEEGGTATSTSNAFGFAVDNAGSVYVGSSFSGAPLKIGGTTASNGTTPGASRWTLKATRIMPIWPNLRLPERWLGPKHSAGMAIASLQPMT